ncbi:MAG: hypothetical protein EI684_19265, partial [Candidatus Viridilinea halotolerans]
MDTAPLLPKALRPCALASKNPSYQGCPPTAASVAPLRQKARRIWKGIAPPMHPDPLADYLAHLDQHLTTRGRRASPATLRAIRSDLRAFIAWWQAARPVAFDLALVLDTDLDDYLTQRQRDGRAAATINRGNASL